MFTCLEMMWNSYRGRFHISYFDRFEMQHPIWVVLRMSVVEVCARNMKIHNETFQWFVFITTWSKVFSRKTWRWVTKIQVKCLLRKNVWELAAMDWWKTASFPWHDSSVLCKVRKFKTPSKLKNMLLWIIAGMFSIS